MQEELLCTVEIGDEVASTRYEYDFGVVTLTTFYATLIDGKPQLTEHSEIRWIDAADLNSVEWAPADVPAVETIMAAYSDARTLRMDLVPDHIRHDTAFGFLDKSVTSEKLFNPMLVSNFESNTMYKTILEELRRSRSFTFSVAFVSPDAIASLKQPLIEFPGCGRIITSTYLGIQLSRIIS